MGRFDVFATRSANDRSLAHCGRPPDIGHLPMGTLDFSHLRYKGQCIPTIVMPFGWVFKGLAATTLVLDLLSQPDRNIGAQGRCAGGARAPRHLCPDCPCLRWQATPSRASSSISGPPTPARAGETQGRLGRAPRICQKSLPATVVVPIITPWSVCTRKPIPLSVSSCTVVDRVAQVTVDPIGTPGGSVSASRSVCKLAVKRISHADRSTSVCFAGDDVLRSRKSARCPTDNLFQRLNCGCGVHIRLL